ncbi:MAG: hypothetical protein WA435_01755 [Gallionellaceae bacterium]
MTQREAIKKQVGELEKRLWIIAEKLGLKRSPETAERVKQIIDGALVRHPEFKRSIMTDDRIEKGIQVRLSASENERLFAWAFVMACFANDHAEKDGSWGVLCEGYYYAGILAESVGERPNEEFLRNLFSKQGKNGALKRHEPMRLLKKWTLKRYQAGKWPSANAAAHALKDEVIAHGKAINAHLTETNAQRTIADWIRKSV